MKLTAWEQFPISVRKAWMVMRLSSFFILFFCLHLSARTTAQRVTLSSTGISVEQFLSQLEKQTPYSFLLKDGLVSPDAKIDVHVSDAPLELVLEQVLKPLGLTYRIDNKAVYILKETKPLPSGGDLSFQDSLPHTIEIHGRVIDSTRRPLAGASITVKGNKTGTSTDANGDFVLFGVKDDATLIITYTGFVKTQVKVNGQAHINISLVPYISELDKVQVIAYGTQTQRFSTGDVSVVDAKTIEQQPVNNPLMALEGRVPGLFITQSTGIPGSAMTVQIRGQNSILSGNDPFYIIDGVPYNSQLLPGLGNIQGISGITNGSATFGSPFSYINSADIESITVLKDADATAIYGSRAANGAILITTKKGKSGATKVDVDVYAGWGKVTREIPMLNTKQYLAIRNEAYNNDGVVPSADPSDPGYAPDLKIWDTTRYTDWQKLLIGSTAHYSNAEVSVSGGNDNTQYLIGAGFSRETTVFSEDFADQKGSMHFNINSSSANRKFRITFSGSYLVDNNQLLQYDPTNFITLAPDAPPVYNKDGTLNWAPGPNGASTWQIGNTNPLANALSRYKNITSNLVSSVIIGYQLLKGLEIRSSFGYTNTQSNEVATFPLAMVQPSFRPYYLANANFANNNTHSWIIEPQAVYKTNIGKGKLEALIGATFQDNTSLGTIVNAQGFSSDNLLENLLAAATVTAGGFTSAEYKYNALFSRVSYNWADKYLINLTARRDGSSRFGPANQFHDFEAAGIGWIFTKENFIANSLPFLSFGKLRGSYGTTGSDQVGNYRYLDLYYPANLNYQNTRGLVINNLYNPNLSWEETKKLEGGIELGFLKDRIYFTASYFLNHSSNQLLGYSLPTTTGFQSVDANQDAVVSNRGWEFLLNTTNINTSRFSWNSSINLTFSTNRLLSVGPTALGIDPNHVGFSLNTAYLFHSMDVDPATGIYQFADRKGIPTSTPDTMTAAIDLNPTYYGGLQNSFRYGGFQLDIFFQFVKQKGPNNIFGNYPGYFYSGNQPLSILNRWQKPGDIKPIQQFNQNGTYYGQFYDATLSDAGYSDASFIRLKNLSLSYQLPGVWKQKMHIQNCQIYLQCQNLLTITNYKGADPETKSFTSLPPLRVITTGLRLTL